VNQKAPNVKAYGKKTTKRKGSALRRAVNFLRDSIVSNGTTHALSLMLRLSVFRVPYLSAVRFTSFPEKLRNRMEWGARKAASIKPQLGQAFRTGKALIVYYTMTGNTEKVAMAIEQGVRKAGLEPMVRKVPEALDEELYDYDLVCLGTPVVHGLPPHPVMKFILEKGYEYRSRGLVWLNRQNLPGKKAVIFVTYSGAHIGVREAIPAGKYLAQSLEHLGFETEEWYVVGEFHGWGQASTKGRMGDIRGRPNAEDLAKIKEKTIQVVKSLTVHKQPAV
jgi:flavodoxin